MALTDLPCWCQISEGDARELIMLLRVNGHQAKSLKQMRLAAQRDWERCARWAEKGDEPRPLTSRPLRVHKMCSAGREARLIRRLAGSAKERDLRRNQERRRRRQEE